MYIRKRFMLLNECEIAELLGEERHYPSFLDNFKDDVKDKFNKKLNSMLKERIRKSVFEIDVQSEYCDKIMFDVTIIPTDTLHDLTKYSMSYRNESEFKDSKIQLPEIVCNLPYDERKNEMNIILCDVFLTHELTHLFDDWMALKNGKKSIFFDNVPSVNYNLAFFGKFQNNGFAKAFSDLIYMANRIEERAYLSEVFSELAYYGCNDKNCQEKMKETIAYRNMVDAKNNFDNELSSADFPVIKVCLNMVKDVLKKLRIKYCGDNEKWQRNELKLLADRVFRRYMQRYYSIVGYYLECKTKNTIKL